MIKIYSAADIGEAHIVKGMLQANGIEAHVGGHYLQGGIGELAALDFATVYIHRDDLEQARQLIDEYEKASVDTIPLPSTDDSSSHLMIPIAVVVISLLLLLITLISR